MFAAGRLFKRALRQHHFDAAPASILLSSRPTFSKSQKSI
jgi:hypothetical protein